VLASWPGAVAAKLPALREALAGRFRPITLPRQPTAAHIDYLEEFHRDGEREVDRVAGPFRSPGGAGGHDPGINKRTAEV